jgi:hypothetical protein
MIADELRRQADLFIDLKKLKSNIERDFAEGQVSRARFGYVRID